MIGRRAVIAFITLGVPLLFAAYFSLDAKIAQVAIYIVLGLCFATIGLTYGWRNAIPRSHLLFISYFLVLAVATSVSLFVQPSIGGVMRLKALAAAFVLMSVFLIASHIVRTPLDLRSAIRGLDVAGFAIAISVYLGAALFAVGIEFGEVLMYDGEVTRSFGPLGDQVAFILALFVIRAFMRANWYLFALHLGAMVLTATRGAFVVLVLAFVVVVLLRALKASGRPRHGTYALLFLTVVGSILLWQLGDFFVGRIANEDVLRLGIDSRLTAMMLGVLVFLDHPVFGTGFGGFKDVVWDYDPLGLVGILNEAYVATTANQIVQTATDGGVPALIVLILFLGGVLMQMNRAIRHLIPSLGVELRSLWVWLLATALGNQSAVWILPDSLLGYTVFLVAGLGCSAALRNIRNAAPIEHFSLAPPTSHPLADSRQPRGLSLS